MASLGCRRQATQHAFMWHHITLKCRCTGDFVESFEKVAEVIMNATMKNPKRVGNAILGAICELRSWCAE